jgi:hypothetical protein
MSALHEDAEAWATGPFAVFELGGYILGVGATIEEAHQRAERAAERDLAMPLRWGECRCEPGAHYVAPIAGELYEMVRLGKRFLIPADAHPDEPSLAAAPQQPPAPGWPRAEIARRFRRAIDPVLVSAERFDALRDDIMAALVEVTGEAIALVARGDAATIARETINVGRAAALARARVADAIAKQGAAT